jgi:hypothetical protein
MSVRYTHANDGDKLEVTATHDTSRELKVSRSRSIISPPRTLHLSIAQYDTHNTGSDDMTGHMDDSLHKRTLFHLGIVHSVSSNSESHFPSKADMTVRILHADALLLFLTAVLFVFLDNDRATKSASSSFPRTSSISKLAVAWRYGALRAPLRHANLFE